jgi:hypothetical protein
MKDDDVHKPIQFIPRASSLPPFRRAKELSNQNQIDDAIRLLDIKDKDEGEEEKILAEDLKNAKAMLNAVRIKTLKFDPTDDCSSDEVSSNKKWPYSRPILRRGVSVPSNFRMPQNEQEAQQRRYSEKLLDNMDGLQQMIYASRNFSTEDSVESDYISDPES